MTIPQPNEFEAPRPVSVHGGHSGEFCQHAVDSLEEVILAYIDRGFAWAGITEHMPPRTDAWRYPDEIDAGLTAADLQARFGRYFSSARLLQNAYAGRIRLYIGFETETYTGAVAYAKELIRQYRPDYVVGSLHHVDNMGIDFSEAGYHEAAVACGGLDALYCRYYDQQYDMLRDLRPAVVGHFDIVRLFDRDYRKRQTQPAVAGRIQRNLEWIAAAGRILDYNVAALSKGASEPYISEPILKQALSMGIPVVPGDDSHGIATVGRFIPDALARLKGFGVDTRNLMRPADVTP